MGAGESKPPPEYEEAKGTFSRDEHRLIWHIFQVLRGEEEAEASGVNKRPSTASLQDSTEDEEPDITFDATVGFDSAQLQTYVSILPQRVAFHLFTYMLDVVPPSGERPLLVNYYNFVVALSHMLKGTVSERAHLVSYLVSGTPGNVTTTQLIRFVEDLLEGYQNTVQKHGEYATWSLSERATSMKGFTTLILEDLAETEVAQLDGDATFSEVDLEVWISKCALFLHMLEVVFRASFPCVQYADHDVRRTLVPRCEGAIWSRFWTLLNLPSLLLLNMAIPPGLQTPWRMLFSSRVHGESFATLLKHILNKGPCVVIVKDTDGYIFGGFTGESLTVKPHFAGGSTTFLFTLHPRMEVFPASGINTNYLYVNHGQETMPNGLGMGGQLQYFGLWIDSEFGKGQSKAKPHCTTFHSPRLSQREDFTIDILEVWGVGIDPSSVWQSVLSSKKKKLEDLIQRDTLVKTASLRWKRRPVLKRQSSDISETKLRLFDALRITRDEGKTSILDKDPESKALLRLLDRGPVSEGLREADPTAEQPEDHHFP